MRFLVCLVLSASVGGCGDFYARRQAAQMAGDDGVCRGYGVGPGSDAYVACRMNLANNRTIADAEARRGYVAMTAAGLDAMRR